MKLAPTLADDMAEAVDFSMTQDAQPRAEKAKADSKQAEGCGHDGHTWRTLNEGVDEQSHVEPGPARPRRASR